MPLPSPGVFMTTAASDTLLVTNDLLILWDIDKTLVDTGALAGRLCDDAFERLSGRKRSMPFVTDGSTDALIIMELFRLHDLAADHLSPAVIAEAYQEAFDTLRDQWHEHARPAVGATEALSTLAGADHVVQSVVTGNVAVNAEAKLAAVGLADHLDFEIGGYGSDDHKARADLVTLARQRASVKYGVPFRPGNTVLVGDTPKDVAAGLVGGARVIAVASGAFGVDELAEAGPHAVLPDLSAVVPTVFEVAAEAA